MSFKVQGQNFGNSTHIDTAEQADTQTLFHPMDHSIHTQIRLIWANIKYKNLTVETCKNNSHIWHIMFILIIENWQLVSQQCNHCKRDFSM